MKKRKLNVLVACESSGVVRDAFRKLGHNALSCDLLPCDADPRYHIQGDVLDLLSGNYAWVCGQKGNRAPNHDKWDLMIAHPPCTYLCNSGVRWLFENPKWRNGKPVCPLSRWVKWKAYGERKSRDILHTRNANEDRYNAMKAAAKFFNRLWNAYPNDGIPHVALENPIMHHYARQECGAGGPDQIIQPWQFGHGETKATCLWLKNLPKLVPTDIVAGREHRIHMMSPGPQRWKARSKTFEGIARAMAEQWSKYIIESK